MAAPSHAELGAVVARLGQCLLALWASKPWGESPGVDLASDKGKNLKKGFGRKGPDAIRHSMSSHPVSRVI